MVKQEVEVVNALGIHARPSSLIVKTAQKFRSSISLVKSGAKADAKSIMSLMMLSATCGSRVTIQASGEDEKEALSTLVSLFEHHFYENEKGEAISEGALHPKDTEKDE
jgi:phosphocarrier protein